MITTTTTAIMELKKHSPLETTEAFLSEEAQV